MNLEQQLNAYAEFLDAESLERLPDHITQTNQGDVTVVDLLTRDEHEAPEADDGGWGRRTPWLMAAAAAILLFIAVTVFLPDSSSEPLDTVDIPEERVDAPGGADASGENAVAGGAEVAALLESAGNELPEVLADVLDPEVALTVDGLEFPTGAGFERLTDTSMSSLVDYQVSGCEGSGTVRCDTVLDFPFLAGNALPQLGTIELVESDGKIVEYTSTTTNLDEAVEGLSLYRGWAVISGVEEELFTPIRTIGFNADAAASHERLAPQFLEAIDVADDPTRIGTLIAAAVAGGHTATLEELFSADEFFWDFAGVAFSADAADLIGVLAGPSYEDIQQSSIDACTFTEPTTMTCTATVTQRHAPNMPASDEIITMTIVDGIVTQWLVNVTNVEEYFGGLAAYADWVFTNHPANFAEMFLNDAGYQNTPESAALHAELAPQYNETLSG